MSVNAKAVWVRQAVGMATWRLHLVKAVYLASDFKFWTITAQTLMNVLALLLRHEGAKLLLTVHLLEIFAHSVVLQNVMRSITYRGNTLLQTAGLALVTIYFFGVIGFMQFPELFQFAEADIMGGRKLEPNNNGARCTSIWKCSLVVLDMGLRKGDLGEVSMIGVWPAVPCVCIGALTFRCRYHQICSKRRGGESTLSR